MFVFCAHFKFFYIFCPKRAASFKKYTICYFSRKLWVFKLFILKISNQIIFLMVIYQGYFLLVPAPAPAPVRRYRLRLRQIFRLRRIPIMYCDVSARVQRVFTFEWYRSANVHVQQLHRLHEWGKLTTYLIYVHSSLHYILLAILLLHSIHTYTSHVTKSHTHEAQCTSPAPFFFVIIFLKILFAIFFSRNNELKSRGMTRGSFL